MPGPDLDLLLEAAEASGKIALRHWKSAPEAWDKPDNAGPVSAADLEVNTYLEGMLRRARPDYGWLSEETLDTSARLGADWSFIIDPIDGTRAFLAGEATFAHSLAIAHRGQVMAAVVHLPAMDLTFSATTDGPALLNGKPVAAGKLTGADGATVLTARANLAPEYWHDPMPALKREFRSSIAYRLCLVAQGRFDATLTLRPTWEWDIAAGDLIATRAGALVSDRLGMAPRYNAKRPQTQGMVAAGSALHGTLIKALRPPV